MYLKKKWKLIEPKILDIKKFEIWLNDYENINN